MKRILATLVLVLFPVLAWAQSSNPTTCLQITKPVPNNPANTNVWGTLLNTNDDIIDQAIAGTLSLALPSASGYPTVILTSVNGGVDQARNSNFVFTGALTSNTLVLWPNSLCRNFSVSNQTTGNFTLTVAVNNGSGGAAGTTLVIPQGIIQMVSDDGTNLHARAASVGTSIIHVKNSSYVASGTYTPSSGMLYATFVCVGAGGGGGGLAAAAGQGGGGGGGGAGGWAVATISAAQVTADGGTEALTIGAAGSAGSVGSPGGAGGSTGVGSHCVASGGSGGSAAQSSAFGFGGAGGSSITGDWGFTGQPGGNSFLIGYITASLPAGNGGQGASGNWGSGGQGGANNGSASPGSSGVGYGCGGGGGGGSNSGAVFGGNGCPGLILVTEYLSQ